MSRARNFLTAGLFLVAAVAFAATPVLAKDDPKAKTTSSKDKAKKDKDKKPDPKKDKKADKKEADQGKATPVGSYGEWHVFSSGAGKAKTCYALAQPKKRAPESLKRDAAYVFISARPAENVKNEVSIIMGFPMKDSSEAAAELGSASFSLIAKGANAWMKNPAEEGRFITAMKKGGKLVVTATSAKGKESTDTYVLTGLSQAMDRIRKECP
jgi:Ni/Co efflux regulator RcnB